MKLLRLLLLSCSLLGAIHAETPDSKSGPQAKTPAGFTIVLTSVPANTPKDAAIYVAGSFNGWQTSNENYRLLPQGPGKYAITLPGTVKGHVEFKFTLGSWDAAEQDDKGVDAPNRKFEVPASGTATYTGTVAKWHLPAQSIPELQKELEKILTDTRTPGVSVAIVRQDGPEWVAGLGQADVASGRKATADTLFRIGSVSKAFAGLAILQLEQQGRLSLLDPVRKLAPEVWFENRWEDTDPVRVVDLLEHTTGWDDMQLPEYAKDAAGLTTREELEADHHSRICRWRPGTRMAYCNSGPTVAAFIVEKLTGQRFEDYVQQHLFMPMGLRTATYFPPAPEQAATLYHNDGRTPYPYWHILGRPAGAINASARDMAAYLSFYLRRGTVAEVPLVPPGAIDRMERPTRNWGAQAGLKFGYGIYNGTFIDDGFVYHGHSGGVQGGLTLLAYLPDQGVGYFYSINSGNGAAFAKIHQAIRAYVARGLTKPKPQAAAPLPAGVEAYAGWYEPNSPRDEIYRFLERLLLLTRIQLKDGQLQTVTLVSGFRQENLLTPVGGSLFRSKADPVATAVLVPPNAEGRFIVGQMGTMRWIPAWEAYLEIGLLAWFLLALAGILLHTPFWLLAGLKRSWRRPQERWLKVWPLVGALSFLAMFGVLALVGEDMINALGKLTGWSVGLFVVSLLFPFASLASAVALWRSRTREIRKRVYAYAVFVSIPLWIAAAYLAYWGLIGVRSWV